MSWRKITWAIVLWCAVWLVLFGIWALNPDPAGSGPTGGVGLARAILHEKPADWQLFDLWFAGFAALSIVWFVTRLRNKARA